LVNEVPSGVPGTVNLDDRSRTRFSPESGARHHPPLRIIVRSLGIREHPGDWGHPEASALISRIWPGVSTAGTNGRRPITVIASRAWYWRKPRPAWVHNSVGVGHVCARGRAQALWLL